MKDFFNVVCLSDNHLYLDPTIVNDPNREDNFSKTYSFDFDLMPDGMYEVTFSFRTKVETDNTLKDIYYISLPDLMPATTYAPERQTTAAITSPILGVVKYNFQAVGLVNRMYHSASPADNPPVLMSKPRSKNFRVLLVPPPMPNPAIPSSYILILHFKRVSCDCV